MKQLKQKNILVLSVSKKISGAEKSLIDLLNHSDPNKFIFHVALPYQSDLKNELQGHVKTLTFNFLRFKRRFHPSYILKCATRIAQITARLYSEIKKKKIDIIYCYNLQSLVYAIPLKVVTGKKIIWHARDIVYPSLLGRFFAFFSSKIVCCSFYISGQIMTPSKKVVIYNGIDTDRWSIDQELSSSLKQELGLPEETVIVAQIGQLIPSKKPEITIAVASQLINEFSRLHFLIIGSDLFDEQDVYIRSLHEMVSKKGLKSRVSLIPNVREIERHISGIDILLHPATHEPFGRVLIEAMALQKPVVAVASGGPNEIIVNGHTGFLTNGSPSDIAQKILLLAKDAELRKIMGKSGRERVIKNFNFRDHLIAMDQVFCT